VSKDPILLTDEEIETLASQAATKAVAQMREFHQGDLKAFKEGMEIGFASVNERMDKVEHRLENVETRLDSVEIKVVHLEKRFDNLEQRFDRVENALTTLLKEFKEERAEVRVLKQQVTELTTRVEFLERKLQDA